MQQEEQKQIDKVEQEEQDDGEHVAQLEGEEGAGSQRTSAARVTAALGFIGRRLETRLGVGAPCQVASQHAGAARPPYPSTCINGQVSKCQTKYCPNGILI